MKLNTWHWIGIVLLVVAIVLIARNRIGPSEPRLVTSTPAPPNLPTAASAP